MSLSLKSSIKESSFGWAALLAIAVPSGAAGYALWKYTNMFGRELSADQGVWGAFGDFIGGSLNPVIGLITISLLVLTLRSQQAEMREQRQQSAKQAFEQTFFTWLNSYRNTVNQFQFLPNNGQGIAIKNGVDAMKWMMSSSSNYGHFDFEKLYGNLSNEQKENLREQEKTKTLDWWTLIFNASEPQLGGIIRTLYTLVRWVDKNSLLSSQDKWDYIAIMRAQLSSPELRTLFFNGYTPAGKPFTQYINRYALLDNLPLDTHYDVTWGISAKTHPFNKSAFDSQTARAALGLAP